MKYQLLKSSAYVNFSARGLEYHAYNLERHIANHVHLENEVEFVIKQYFELVPEVGNKHDRNAVLVRAGQFDLGYFPSSKSKFWPLPIADNYHRYLLELRQHGPVYAIGRLKVYKEHGAIVDSYLDMQLADAPGDCELSEIGDIDKVFYAKYRFPGQQNLIQFTPLLGQTVSKAIGFKPKQSSQISSAPRVRTGSKAAATSTPEMTPQQVGCAIWALAIPISLVFISWAPVVSIFILIAAGSIHAAYKKSK